MTNAPLHRSHSLTSALYWTLRLANRGPAALAALLVLAACRLAAAAAAVTAATAAAAPSSADDLVSTLLTYGPVTGGMYVVYLIARSLVDRYAQISWLAATLAPGKRLAYTTSALGVTGAALQALIAGSTWNVILAAAMAAAFKLLMPTGSTPAPATTSTSGISGVPTAITPTATAAPIAIPSAPGSISGMIPGRAP